MQSNNAAIGKQDRFDQAIKAAQAKSALTGLYISLVANSFISTSIAALLWINHRNPEIFVWLVVILLMNASRLASAAVFQYRGLAEYRPKLLLNMLTAGAFLGGLAWAFIPFAMSDIGAGGYDGYVVFIIAGICAGALIQNTAYAPPAVAFMAPPLVTLDLMMLTSGNLTNVIVGVNAVLLTIMMLRSSFAAQKQFHNHALTAVEAAEMASSLASANKRIIESNEKLEIMASRDSLTGLANRAAFNLALGERMLKVGDNSAEVALIILDLDRFKAINDTFGHKAGDHLLVKFAQTLSQFARPEDLVSRLGGDEFAVIMQGSEIDSRAVSFCHKVNATFSQPVTIQGKQIISGTSAGIAVAPEHARDADGIFTCADMALYASKEAGRRRFRIFDSNLRSQLNRQRQIESSIHEAVEGHQLEAYFQPQVSLKTGKIIGFEALLRWSHPELGEINPVEITDAAAHNHALEQVTSFMIARACEFIGKLDAHGYSNVYVAVNISPRDFASYSPIDVLKQITEDYGVLPGRLEIEITEETLFDTKNSNDKLRELKEAGFRVAVDDFGMGHSSLVYLVDMKIDQLKVDRTFADSISTSRQNQALIMALLSIGKALDIEILVEGVENDDDATKLLELGCDNAQGFLFAPALPPEFALNWLKGRQESTATRTSPGTTIRPTRRIS